MTAMDDGEATTDDDFCAERFFYGLSSIVRGLHFCKVVFLTSKADGDESGRPHGSFGRIPLD